MPFLANSFKGAVVEWLGNGLQIRLTPVRIRSAPPRLLPHQLLFQFFDATQD